MNLEIWCSICLEFWLLWGFFWMGDVIQKLSIFKMGFFNISTCICLSNVGYIWCECELNIYIQYFWMKCTFVYQKLRILRIVFTLILVNVGSHVFSRSVNDILNDDRSWYFIDHTVQWVPLTILMTWYDWVLLTILTPRYDWVLLTILAILFQQIIFLVPKTVKINEIK